MLRPDATRFESFAEEYTYWRTLEFNAATFDALLHSVPQGEVLALDAGCGSGLLTFRLASRCRAVIGLDVSWAMLRLARSSRRQLGVANVHFVVADLEALPFRAGAFGFLLASYALHRTPLHATLPALRDVIAPGGRLAIVDVVSRWPRLEALPVWAALRWLLPVPYYLRRHGPRATWRIVRFLLRRSWMANVTGYRKLTPDVMTRECGHFLPRCVITHQGARMMVLWESAPALAE